MDSSPIVVTAYYIQNLIQLIGPNETSKILEKLRKEKLFAEVDENLDKLAAKVAKDGKKVVTGMKVVKKEMKTALEKTGGKKVFQLSIAMTKKLGTRNVVGIIGKKVPILSAGVGTGLALWRILENPHSEEAWIKAGAEVASGTASCFPGVGTAVSLTIDGILVASDMENATKEAINESNDQEMQKKKIKKHKMPIPSLFTFSYQGNDLCHVTKLDRRFRVPQNFEICFFCSHDSVLPNYVQTDVLFFSMIARETATHKINFTECVIPSNCFEKLSSGDMCNDYKIVLTDKNVATSDADFYLGLTKWTPKWDPKILVATPLTEKDSKYFTLSQLVGDLGRKENFAQKCVLLFLCNRNDDSDEYDVSERIIVWNDRMKQLIPIFPTQDKSSKESLNEI